jgi:hypothetical protein
MITIPIKHKIVEGRRLVEVPLDIKKGGTDFCIMEEEVFNTLLDLGCVPLLKFKQGCVWLRSKAKVRCSKAADVSVARVILDCDVGTCVRYLDSNPKNMCYSNMIRCPGMSLYRQSTK